MTINFISKAYVSSMGVLCVDQHLDWIPLVRIARNCHEQNLTAILSHNDSAIVLQTMRTIAVGEELKVWLSPQLIVQMNVPFLSPHNIINDHCYQCHICGANFSQPNPLKIHLTFDCKSNIVISTPVMPIAESSGMQRSIRETNLRVTREARSHTCIFCGKFWFTCVKFCLTIIQNQAKYIHGNMASKSTSAHILVRSRCGVAIVADRSAIRPI